MVFWKSLEQRSLESAATNAVDYFPIAKNICGPVQLSRLISWLAAHEFLSNSSSEHFQSTIRGLLCNEIRALDLDIADINAEFLIELANRCGPSLELLKL